MDPAERDRIDRDAFRFVVRLYSVYAVLGLIALVVFLLLR